MLKWVQHIIMEKMKTYSKNTDKKTEWKDGAKRLVLYADIMGFSHRVTFSKHKKLKKELQGFKTFWQKRIKPLEQGNYIKSVQFSDSILIVANGTSKKMFNLTTKSAVCLMQSAIKLDFPIKGVLAQGEFSYDKDNELYFGLPLVEAYQLHNEMHYYGIIVHHSAEPIVKKYSDAKNPYTKMTIPLKNGKALHYHLSWYSLDETLNPKNIKQSVNDWLDKIEEGVSGTPRIYVDNTRDVISNDKEYCEESEPSV